MRAACEERGLGLEPMLPGAANGAAFLFPDQVCAVSDLVWFREWNPLFSFAMMKVGKSKCGSSRGHDALCRFKGMDGTSRLEAIPLISYNRREAGVSIGGRA